jgi:heptosyltransferase I
VHALPVVTAIKRHSPSTKLTWILQPGPADFIRGHPSVDEIIVFQRSKGLEGFIEIFPELRKRKFDLVINLQVYLKGGLMTLFSRAPIKVGFDHTRARDLNWLFTSHRIPKHPQQHVQDQYIEFLDWLGVPAEPLVWNMGPWDHERAWQQEYFSQFSRPTAAIVVATSKPGKDWAPKRWAEVCDRLYNEHGLQPVLVGGTTPRELAAEHIIKSRATTPVVSALGSGLRKLVSILDGSALVLSSDTGPLHMSAALNKPVIALMGPTNPKRVGPYRKFRDLMIDKYGNPGEDYPIKMEFRKGRMDQITVDDVMEKVAVWEKNYKNRR